MTTPTAGRTTRGKGRTITRPHPDYITIQIPLTASGTIDPDDLTAALATLLTYTPTHYLQPTQFRPILANALLTAAQRNEP